MNRLADQREPRYGTRDHVLHHILNFLVRVILVSGFQYLVGFYGLHGEITSFQQFGDGTHPVKDNAPRVFHGQKGRNRFLQRGIG